MKWVKGLGYGLIIFGIGGGLLWQVWLKEQFAFGQVAAAFGAKSVCSCRFVSQRPMDSCLTDFAFDVSALSFEETESDITASAFGGMVSAKASFRPGAGCAVTE